MKPLLAAIIIALVLASGCSSPKHSRPGAASDDARAYLEMLRSDFNAEKIRVLNQVMQLTEPEADRFWPIYRDYERDLATIGDRKLALIRDFLGRHKAGTLTEASSKELATQWLANVQDRLDLWKKYHQKISDGVSAVRAAQFLQVEHQLALFVDLNIASEMPMVRTISTPK